MKECLSCHGKIGWFRRMANHRFCCQEHEEAFFVELQKLAISRLQQAVTGVPVDTEQTIVPSEVHADAADLLTPAPAAS